MKTIVTKHKLLNYDFSTIPSSQYTLKRLQAAAPLVKPLSFLANLSWERAILRKTSYIKSSIFDATLSTPPGLLFDYFEK